MKKNLGEDDRIVRFVLASLCSFFYLQEILSGIWGMMLIGLAGLFVITSVLGLCPFYSLLKLRTDGRE